MATLPSLKLPGTWYYWFAGAAMGFLWYGSVILYSISTVKLGDLGTSIGWPLFMASIVIVSAIIGAVTGEWSHTGKQPARIMIAGVVCLVFAIALLGYASRPPSANVKKVRELGPISRFAVAVATRPARR